MYRFHIRAGVLTYAFALSVGVLWCLYVLMVVFCLSGASCVSWLCLPGFFFYIGALPYTQVDASRCAVLKNWSPSYGIETLLLELRKEMASTHNRRSAQPAEGSTY